jgi:hypothetical protein
MRSLPPLFLAAMRVAGRRPVGWRVAPRARRQRTLGGRPSLQHTGNPKVLVEVGPVNPHRHQLEARAARKLASISWRGTGMALDPAI